METQMESFKKKARLSRRFSSRKGLGSLKTRFKRFLSDHHVDAGETQGSHSASSDSETDERKASSPTPDRNGEIKKSLSSGSSSYSDEGSPSKMKDMEKSDSSSDSSEKKRKMEPSKKSSEKRLQVHLQEERQEVFRLPPLEETPPSSPRSNPRFSTGAQSDYGRLSTHTSAPNSPANLSHNFNLNYRGGDSSPVALIHSLSAKESGKHASQLSEISFASPPSSSSLDLDAPGDKVDEFKASPSKTSPSLKPDVLPIVHHDEEQGVWRCGTCGWIYPNPNPSLRNRREHKKYCGEITNVQRWLGAQDIHDTPDEGASKLEESEVSEGSGLLEESSAGDEHPMAKSEGEDIHEGVSDMSTEPHGAVDQGRLDEIESPDQHAVGGVGNDERNSNGVVDPDEVDDQMKVDKVLEWPTPDTEIKDPSSSGERLSKKSISDQGVEDQSKLEDVSNGSTGHHEIEKVDKLDDLVDRGLDVSDPTRGASNVAPEVQNEEEEPVATEDNLEEAIGDARSPQMFGSQIAAHENQPNQKALEEMENEVGDVEVPPVKCNGKLEESGQHSLFAVHPDGHDLVHVDNIEGVKEEDASASQDCTEHLNHPHGNGLTEVPEVRTELSVLTSASGIEGGRGIEVSQSLRNEEAGTVKEIEKMEPRITADNGKPIGEAHVQESKAMEPSVSTADLQSGKEHADDKIGRMVEHEGVGKGSEKRSDKGLGTPDGLLGSERDVKSNGHEFPEHSNQHRVTETDSAKGNSSQVSPAQGNGIATETKGRSAESPSPLEEPSKWVNTGSFTSPKDGDSFSSMQKYWADVTSSKFLLVEGKRSPSFGGSSEVEFPSFRNGDGRRSPSPFSLSKSEHGEAQSQSSIDSANYRSTVEDKDEDKAIPSEELRRSRSFLSPTKSDHGEIQSQSSVDSVSYRSTGEDKNEDRAIPSGEGRGSPSLSKSDHGEIQSQSAVDSVEDTGEGRAIASGAAIEHCGSSSSTSHVVYDLEKVVEWQNTHDLICPVCGSDVTKRIILRKRKRTPVSEDDGRLAKEIMIEQGDAGQDQRSQKDDNDDKTWGCLACLSFFIRRDNGETEAVAPLSSIYGEQARFRCLPKLFPWGPGTSEPELQQPLLGATGREEGPREVPRLIQESPLDDDEQVSCFSYLQRFQAQPPALDTPEGSDSGLGAASRTESLKVEAEEKGSYNCLPDLHAFSWGPIPVYTHPPLDMDESPGMEGYKESNALSVPGPSHKVRQEPSLKGESIEELPSKLQAEIEYKAQIVSHELPVKERTSLIGLLDRIGISSPRVDNARTESEEKEKCECLPISIFRSESYFPLKAGTDSTASPEGCLESDTGSSASLAAREFNPVKSPSTEGSSDFLPASMPAFPWGSSSKYDLPSSPGILSSQQEITMVTESDAAPSQLLTGGPQRLEDAEEKKSGNCLPELLPAFSWGPAPVYAPLDTDESPGMTQGMDGGEEKRSCNCLPELIPAFSWGPAPGYTPLDTDESPGMEGHKEATAGSTTAALAEEPQFLDDAKEHGSFNCLPELLPTFSWGAIPVYTHPPLDTDATTQRQPQPPGTVGLVHEVPQEDDEALPDLKGKRVVDESYSSPDTSTEKAGDSLRPKEASTNTSSHVETESKDMASCNCIPLELPELLPTFSWGAIRVFTHPPLDTDATTQRQPQPPGTIGLVHEVPQVDDGALPDLKRKGVVDESYSSPGTSTDKAGDSWRPEEASINTSSHVETESKDMASCLCIPFELQEIRWGFNKRTTHDNDLREPLISRGVDGDIEPTAAGPVLLDDSSLIDSKQTAGIPEPLRLPRLAEGLQAPPAGPGTKVDSALSAVEYSPFTIDLSEGTQFTESEDFHIEGTVTSHKTVTKPEVNGGPPEVHDHESNYRFKVDIQDAHFTSSIEKLQPKPSQTLGEITDCDVDSYTQSSGSPANASLESVVQDRPGDIGAETSGDNIVQHPKAPSDGLVKENQAASSGTVPEPVQTIIRGTFPADPIQVETEAQETPREESKLWNDSCICLPLSLPTVRWWGPSRGLEEALEADLLDKLDVVRFLRKQKLLLDKAERNQGAANESDVQIQPTLTRHESAVAAAGERCNCLPALPKFSLYHVFRDHHLSPELQQPGAEVDDIRTPLLGRAPPKRETVVHIEQTTETNITVDGPASEGAALEAIADTQDQIPSQGESTSQEYLKSFVHGGLDVTLVSLGVVASAAGGDAKTLTVIAIGLASLVFGIVTHFSNVISLFYNNRPKFLDEVGQGFVHGCLSNLSFLFFGALAPVTYGFAFQNATNRYYKMAATIVVALVSIVLLGAAKAHVQSKSAVRVISLLVVTGFVAAVGGYETGQFVSQVLEYFGFSSV